MSHATQEHERDLQLVEHTRNTARYFTEQRHVAWVALALTLAFGAYGYLHMPKAKDPRIIVRVAVAVCTWPGIEASRVEELVTRKIEQRLADASSIERLESMTRTGFAAVYVTLKENVSDTTKEWNDIQARLQAIRDLPQGAGPIQFQRDFGETATLLLTVASPAVGDVELELRARALRSAIERARAAHGDSKRATLVVNFPPDVPVEPLQRLHDEAREYFDEQPGIRGTIVLQGPGFLGLDLATDLADGALQERLNAFAADRLRLSELPPDIWSPIVVHDPARTRDLLAEVAAAQYSYRELEAFTQTLQTHLQAVPLVAKVTRSGVLQERVYLDYSQERLATYQLAPSQLPGLLGTRNITAAAGVLELGDKNVLVAATGQFQDETQIGDVVATKNQSGSPVYLRDLVEISRDYESPARFLNFLTARDANGKFVRTRAITLAIDMRAGEQIAEFGTQVDRALAAAQKLMPEDLIVRRTSDQPQQVRENVDLFMKSLYEAVALVVMVGLIGFWEWRAALLLAACIPITLAMTFGFMHLLGLDLQQISIASLIIALGLLVDDPIVASDAIKRSLQAGWKARIAAWLGPTKLATAIMFATVTNIASYLPFLTLGGDTGVFIRTLPIVLSLSLIASRIVSMTFVPLLAVYLLRADGSAHDQSERARRSRFGRGYSAVVGWAIDHRLAVFAASIAVLMGAGLVCRDVKSAFFPKDLSYLSYVDVWLPEDAPLQATRDAARQAGAVIRSVSSAYGRSHPHSDGTPREVLESITEFLGGGAPRFWFSVAPEVQQLNYAQLLIQVKSKWDTQQLVPLLQRALSAQVAGARIDVHELETGKPVGNPVSLRISGEDIDVLRSLAERAKTILRNTRGAERVRDDWGADTVSVRIDVDADRADFAGVTNLDVARASSTALHGSPVGELREGTRQIPILLRLRASERSQPSTLESLYVNAAATSRSVPLRQVASSTLGLQTEKIRRRNQFRTITVSCFPAAGMLSSEVLAAARRPIAQLQAALPPGTKLAIGGEAEEQVRSDAEMALVLGLLLGAIYLALVVQFRNALKPLIVFAALPFGVVAAVVALVVTGAPLGFMASLGVISLLGVIVSHVIVLFDFIEEARERGEPMRQALIDAGLMRLRPVLITVVATILGLIPLAAHGGPLWQPLCYTQIGGLSFATVVTLLLVPVLYTIAVEDLKWLRWERRETDALGHEASAPMGRSSEAGATATSLVHGRRNPVRAVWIRLIP